MKESKIEEIRIRRMEPEDVEAVSRLEEQIFSQPWSSQGFLDALSMGHAIFLVSEVAGELAGYCGMYCAADEGEITNVAVKEVFRKQGVGRCLVKQLLKEARAASVTNVILEVRMSNTEAIRLYERMGFSIQGIRKGFYEKPREDGYVMTLSQ